MSKNITREQWQSLSCEERNFTFGLLDSATLNRAWFFNYLCSFHNRGLLTVSDYNKLNESTVIKLKERVGTINIVHPEPEVFKSEEPSIQKDDSKANDTPTQTNDVVVESNNVETNTDASEKSEFNGLFNKIFQLAAAGIIGLLLIIIFISMYIYR